LQGQRNLQQFPGILYIRKSLLDTILSKRVTGNTKTILMSSSTTKIHGRKPTNLLQKSPKEKHTTPRNHLRENRQSCFRKHTKGNPSDNLPARKQCANSKHFAARNHSDF
jgi:hypothetical protein